MSRKLAVVAALPMSIVLAAPAHSVPNPEVFLQSIAADGIAMDGNRAIAEGQSVCAFLAPPHDVGLWDAALQIESKHPDWRMDMALKFADRSVQNFCPYRGRH